MVPQTTGKYGGDMPGENILIVDDEPLIGSSLKSELNDAGYHVDSVLSGVEALEAVKRKKYDVVFIDEVMPGMDGVETCKAIMKISAGSILIYMTGVFDSDNVVKELQFVDAGGQVHYLYKPFGTGEVLQVIVKALSGRK